MAAAIGNEYAANARRWRSAIDKALENRCKSDGQAALIKIAERMLEAADEGESWAMKEIGDRLDGRPHQTSDVNVDAKVTEYIQGNKVYVGDSGDE